MTNREHLKFDSATFLKNFVGMEDVARDAVRSFLELLPEMLTQLETAVGGGNPKELEVAAHTLKGVLSNFHAEPTRSLAWQLEQEGRQPGDLNKAAILNELSVELTLLRSELEEFLNE